MADTYRARWIMHSCCKLDDSLDFRGTTISVIGEITQTPLILLVENVLTVNGKIEDAFYESWEKMNLFCIACSYIGYGQSTIIRHVATIPTNFDQLPEFSVLVTKVINTTTKNYHVTQSDLSSIDKALDSKHSDSLMCIASALRSDSIEEKTTLLHSGCQAMAVAEGVETVKVKCTHCDQVTDTGRPATNNYIKKIFAATGTNSLYNTFSDLRHKIGHRRPLNSLEEHLDAKFHMASIQGYTTGNLDLLLSFTRSVGKQLITGLPYAVYKFARNSGGFQIAHPEDFSGEVAVSSVSGTWTEKGSYTFNFGISTDYGQVFDQQLINYIFCEKSA